jgi:hypothetical protein
MNQLRTVSAEELGRVEGGCWLSDLFEMLVSVISGQPWL